MLRTHAHHLEVLLKVQLERPQGAAEVVRGLRDARKGQDDVAGGHLGLDPVVFPEDVPLMKGKAIPPLEALQALAAEVEGHDLVIGLVQDLLDQMAPDEASRARQKNTQSLQSSQNKQIAPSSSGDAARHLHPGGTAS